MTRDKAVLAMITGGFDYTNEEDIWTKVITKDLTLSVSLANMTAQWLVNESYDVIEDQYFDTLDHLFDYVENLVLPTKKSYRLVVDEIINAWNEDDATSQIEDILRDNWELVEMGAEE